MKSEVKYINDNMPMWIQIFSTLSYLNIVLIFISWGIKLSIIYLLFIYFVPVIIIRIFSPSWRWVWALLILFWFFYFKIQISEWNLFFQIGFVMMLLANHAYDYYRTRILKDRQTILHIGFLIKVFCEKCSINTAKNIHVNANWIKTLLEYGTNLPKWHIPHFLCNNEIRDLIIAGLLNASDVIKDPNFGEFIDCKNIADFLCNFAYHNQALSEYKLNDVAEILKEIYEY